MTLVYFNSRQQFVHSISKLWASQVNRLRPIQSGRQQGHYSATCDSNTCALSLSNLEPKLLNFHGDPGANHVCMLWPHTDLNRGVGSVAALEPQQPKICSRILGSFVDIFSCGMQQSHQVSAADDWIGTISFYSSRVSSSTFLSDAWTLQIFFRYSAPWRQFFPSPKLSPRDPMFILDFRRIEAGKQLH